MLATNGRRQRPRSRGDSLARCIWGAEAGPCNSQQWITRGHDEMYWDTALRKMVILPLP